jgi:hypothetical protein
MNEEERRELKAEIKQEVAARYFLIPRNAWWAFLGGALAFAVAVGAISYKSALAAISAPAVAAAQQKIFDAEKAAKRFTAGHLKFEKKCVARDSNGCKPIRPPCSPGFVDAGFGVENTWEGGQCGQGHVCSVCYTFTDK